MAQVIELPYKLSFRHYQKELFQAFFVDGYTRFLCIEHRRAGKDLLDFSLMVAASQMRVGTYFYAFPTIKRAKAVIWRGIDNEGRRYLDYIPPQLIAKTNQIESFIEFKNGSIIQLVGTYNIEGNIGTNPIGIVFSEAQTHSPLAWELFSPILIQNGGWAKFNGTPRGHNHLYKLYNINKDNPEWFTRLLTVDDTFVDEEKLIPVVSKEKIESARRAGMSDEMIQQEFYCSFDAALPGAFYSKQLQKAFDEERICELPIERNWATYTAWDLGNDDDTAIWIIQVKSSEIRLIHYYQNRKQPMDHYAKYLLDFEREHNLKYHIHFGPHDAAHTEQTTNITRMRYLSRCGINFRLVRAGAGSVEEGIEATRNLFQRFRIDRKACEFGIECLKEYHSKYDEKRQTYTAPYHNWASHCCDALRYFSLGYCDASNIKVGIRKLEDWDPL